MDVAIANAKPNVISLFSCLHTHTRARTRPSMHVHTPLICTHTHDDDKGRKYRQPRPAAHLPSTIYIYRMRRRPFIHRNRHRYGSIYGCNDTDEFLYIVMVEIENVKWNRLNNYRLCARYIFESQIEKGDTMCVWWFKTIVKSSVEWQWLRQLAVKLNRIR